MLEDLLENEHISAETYEALKKYYEPKYKFTLEKESIPGWKLETDHIENVVDILRHCICSDCRTEDLPDNYGTLSPMDKIHSLLDTACGYEFYLNVNHEE